MDIYNLEKHLQLASFSGSTLSTEERISLALDTITQSNTDIDEYKFWGRIETPTKNYYIIVGYTYSVYQFPHKTFFWGTNPNYQFLKLTDILYEQHKTHLEKINNIFVGEPEKIIVNLQEEVEGEEKEENQQANQQAKNEGNNQNQQNDQEETKVLKKNLTQLNRLSVVVRAIQNDCQIVPIQSYKMSPQHSLAINENYNSKSLEQTLSIKNWQHFRAPQSSQKRKAIEEQNVIFSYDFLDPITDDKPAGCWSSQYDISDSVVSVRNLFWQGYFAYQKLNSNLFGSCYFGNGCKNVNLAFQL